MYEATINSDLTQYEQRIYKGIAERVFKQRNKEHKLAFNNPNKKTNSKLSEEIWKIREAGGIPQVTWKILKRRKSYKLQAKRCALCLTERLAIAEHRGRDILNKRSEIVAKYRHQLKYQLAKIDSKD